MTTHATDTTPAAPRTAEEAREPREELLSGSTPGGMPAGEGVIERDAPEDRAQDGADERAAAERSQGDAPRLTR